MKHKTGQFPLIILAGGNSTRLGFPKGLVEYESKPWLVWQLARFAEAGGENAVVILGGAFEQYLEILPSLIVSLEEPIDIGGVAVQTRINNIYTKGPMSSLQVAARTCLTDIELCSAGGAFVLPVDVPAPQPAVWQAMARALTNRAILAVQPWCENNGRKTGGHPILLTNSLLQTILRFDPEDPEARLDFLLRDLPPEQLQRVVVDDALVTLNLNTKEQWSEFLRRTPQI